MVNTHSVDIYAGYMWLLDEWKYSGTHNPEVSTYNLLYDAVKEMSEEDYKQTRKDYENIIIKALKHCDDMGLFGSGAEREALVIYVHYSDDYDAGEIDNRSAKILNSNTTYALFEARWNQKKDNLTQVVAQNTCDITI